MPTKSTARVDAETAAEREYGVRLPTIIPDETRRAASLRRKANWAAGLGADVSALAKHLRAAGRQQERRARVEDRPAPAGCLSSSPAMLAEAHAVCGTTASVRLLGVMFSATDRGRDLALPCASWERAEAIFLLTTKPEPGHRQPRCARVETFAAGAPQFSRLLACLTAAECAGDARLRDLADQLAKGIPRFPEPVANVPATLPSPSALSAP